MHNFTKILLSIILMTAAAAEARELPFAEAVLEHMRCDRAPTPTPFFTAIDKAGRLDKEGDFGADSISCFPILGGVTIEGMEFDSICGFEEDKSVPRWSDFFYRGPGTSPGQHMSLQTRAPQSELLTWARNHIGGPRVDKLVTERFEYQAPGSALECSSRITR
jgi:hypothetical protein